MFQIKKFDKEEDGLMLDKALYGLFRAARKFHKKLITIMITKMKKRVYMA